MAPPKAKPRRRATVVVYVCPECEDRWPVFTGEAKRLRNCPRCEHPGVPESEYREIKARS